MHVRFFTIPVHDGEEAAAEVNCFLAVHRVVAIDRELIHDGAGSVWAVAVTVVQAESRPQIPKKGAADYKHVLNETQFAVFVRLRGGTTTLRDTRSGYRNRNEPGKRNDNLGFRGARASGWTGGSASEQAGLPAIMRRMAKPRAAAVVVGSGGPGPNPRRPADTEQRRWSAARCQ